ncbi:NAD-dependent epimerase/dehydratase family protein [Actinomadura rudentiformis]|uniref:NAD-dependent epimerase/dehydratase family protein n=1 Tax=Actinomadura rudentiformis TaxID=359158 RepID=A0A6H9YP02_9ACTN|nr:NAD-dependent epimerase/dehydratase family protein [Actinomadura rudentiformis]KAB2344385.1 NAD-dependent epimerase/dehydratase family protein [Actinomadura rudentiformis]
MGLTVAVTGPTGEIGTAAVRALEDDDRVERIVGMARRPFDPASRGWKKTAYHQGDIQDRSAVDALVAEADVVVHLAFIILGSHKESERVNLAGTRNVFEATQAAERPSRLVYTSSVAAYGYHADNPVPLTEDVPPRGSDAHYYSAQKAACEKLLAETTEGLDVYVLRPCIVAGPEATVLLRNLPWEQAAPYVPDPLRRLLGAVPGLRPVLPDPGVRFQLVHHDDVAAALAAAVAGDGPPGAYNLAADGELTIGDLARAIGAYSIPVPSDVVTVTAGLVDLLPLMPSQAEWIHAARHPMIMDTAKARRDLGWSPRHTAHQTLKAMAQARR